MGESTAELLDSNNDSSEATTTRIMDGGVTPNVEQQQSDRVDTSSAVATGSGSLLAVAASSRDTEVEVSKSKRRGDYMTKDDYERDDDDDDDDPSSSSKDFPRASQEELRKRRIVRVPRTDSGKYDAAAAAKKSTNPFGSVSLIAPAATATAKSNETSETTTTTAAPSIFGASTNFFGFGAGSSSSTSTGGGGFGGFATTTNTESAAAQPSAMVGFGGFGSAASQPQQSSAAPPILSFGGFGASGVVGGFGDQQPPSSSSSFVFAPAVAADSTTTTSWHSLQNTYKGDSVVEASTAAAIPTAVVANLPSDYELKSGEEDEALLFARRCKTFRWGPSSTNDDSNNTSGVAASASVPPSFASAVPSVPPSSQQQLSLPSVATTSTTTIDEADMAASGNAAAAGASPTNETSERINHKDPEDNGAQKEYTWHEVGIGPLKVLQRQDGTSSTRFVQRRESTPGGPATTVILNLRLVPSQTTIEMPTEKHVRVVTAIVVAATTTTAIYLFKFKLASEAQELFDCLQTILTETVVNNNNDANDKQ